MSVELPKKVVCIGAGYVGGPTMAMIALKCPMIEVREGKTFARRVYGSSRIFSRSEWPIPVE
eukprot:6320958-Pyramimonas_sp.AAC.1